VTVFSFTYKHGFSRGHIPELLFYQVFQEMMFKIPYKKGKNLKSIFKANKNIGVSLISEKQKYCC